MITYERNKHKIEDIINIIKNEGVEIIDISTEDGNLEDVFIQLTKN
jgi:ABC-2 type transport system ATP-binding protein